MFNFDIVLSGIPLLLSQKSMKKAHMTLDFKSNQAVVFGESVKLIDTKSGHYAIHIDPYNTILTSAVSGVNAHVTLIATDNTKSKSDVDLKLHRQFAHPATE